MKNIRKNIVYVGLVFATLVPAISFAALDGIKDLLCSFGQILNLIIPLIFGLALIFFFWGLAQFILHASEESAREEGRNKMIWGIIALFVMVSIYGILNWFGDLIGIHPPSGTRTSGCIEEIVTTTIVFPEQ